MKSQTFWTRGLLAFVAAAALVVAGVICVGLPARAETDNDDHAEHSDHAAEPAHDDHAAEVGHDEEATLAHEGEELVHLTEAERAQMRMTVEEARLNPMQVELKLPAEVRLDEDRVAHVVPRLAGIVAEVSGRVGAKVKKGEVLAVLESRELADAQAESLAAAARLALAEKTFAREKDLWEKQISAEKDYLEAVRDREEARIALRAATQKLDALGIPPQNGKGGSLTRYEIRAPFDGEIVEKHIVLGEFVNGETDVFLLADLTTVWVDVNVFQNDLPRLAEGQQVALGGPPGLPAARGTISYIAPMIDRATRTALARIVLPNESGQWRPGLFVDVSMTTQGGGDAVTVPKSAVQRVGEQQVVFVENGEGFALRPVVVGGENGDDVVQIARGLAAGERVVVEGAFELKAKLVTSGMGSHAGHGH